MIPELKGTIIDPHHINDEMNATCAYFPQLIYMFAKSIDAEHILEVGTAEGYGSYYLAKAAQETKGMFYGIDINQGLVDKVNAKLENEGLPHQLICADTKELTSLPFPRVDIAFLDGEHTSEAVLHEIELIYPILNKRGLGWIFIHDVVDCGNSEAWLKLTQDKRFESTCIHAHYGLGILRAIEGMESYESLAKRFGVLKL
jgi:predicted O-methyltransferase YrrM